jgi:hypothetical protein
MSRAPEKVPLISSGFRRKLTDALIIIVLVPLLIFEIILLLVLLAISPGAWRPVSHGASRSEPADRSGPGIS